MADSLPATSERWFPMHDHCTRSGIYCITNISSGKCYVGSAVHLQARHRQHWHLLRYGRHFNRHLQSAFDRYGKDRFQFAVLEYCPPADLVERETWWMELLRTRDQSKGYNIALPGCTNLGREWPEEMRARLSAALKGRPRSEESVAKQRLYVATPEHRANLSKSSKGKTLSQEHRQKLSVLALGRVIPEEQRSKISNRKSGAFTYC